MTAHQFRPDNILKKRTFIMMFLWISFYFKNIRRTNTEYTFNYILNVILKLCIANLTPLLYFIINILILNFEFLFEFFLLILIFNLIFKLLIFLCNLEEMKQQSSLNTVTKNKIVNTFFYQIPLNI